MSQLVWSVGVFSVCFVLFCFAVVILIDRYYIYAYICLCLRDWKLMACLFL